MFLGRAGFDLDFVHQGEACLFSHLDELVAALSQQVEKLVEAVVTRNRATGNRIEKGTRQIEKRFRRACLQVVLIEMVEFSEIGLGTRSSNVLEIEIFGDLCGRKYFLITVRPTETREPVQHRLGEIAVRFELLDRDRVFALREFAAAFGHDERYVPERGDGGVECVVERELKGRIAEVVGASDDMCHVHVEIVDDDREMEEGGSVAAPNDSVTDLARVLTARSEDEIIPPQ